jgi:WD40 repeat protein
LLGKGLEMKIKMKILCIIDPRGIAAILGIFLLFPDLIFAQITRDPSRRERETPGLMLDTMARQGACDVLKFTPDGKRLIVTGDDKIIHVYKLEGERLEFERSLRWPTFREFRGMIFTIDFNPKDPNQIAVAGIGVKTSLIAILNFTTGQLLQTYMLPKLETIWHVKYSPDGQRLLAGNDQGGVYQITVATGAIETRLKDTPKSGIQGEANRVRLINFVDGDTFLTLAQDGKLHQFRGTDKSGPISSRPVHLPSPYRAVYSAGTKKIAIVGEEIKVGEEKAAREIEYTDLLGRHEFLTLQLDPRGENPSSLVFDAEGKQLAVGTHLFNRNVERTLGGHVQLFDLNSVPAKRSSNSWKFNNKVERLAFHPQNSNLLAVAAGDDHEIHLINTTQPGKIAQTVRNPWGESLWGVKLAKDNKRIYFSSDRDPNSVDPNDRVKGEWRSFEIASGKVTPGAKLDDAVAPKLTLDSWSVAKTKNPYVWEVVGPNSRTALTGAFYDTAINMLPMCYTFVKNANFGDMLVVGHKWGASLYKLDAKNAKNAVKLIRVMTGHEGDVTALAVSKEGDLLITASRDMTLCGWSLSDWDGIRSELGASFLQNEGRVLVSKVVGGSPAWEVGLANPRAAAKGFQIHDEIQMAMIAATREIYVSPKADGLLKNYVEIGNFSPEVLKFKQLTAAQLLAYLAEPVPNKQIAFVWKSEAGGGTFFEQTSVRNRPLWRFFPTKDNKYLVWLWRDYWYDTNFDQAEKIAGWLTWDKKLKETPRWSPLFASKDRLDPNRVRAALTQAFREPDLANFLQIEPAEAKIQIVRKPDGLKKTSAIVNIEAKAIQRTTESQKIRSIELWVNEQLLKTYTPGIDPYQFRQPNIEISEREFRTGLNKIEVRVVNQGDARSSTVEDVDGFTSERKRRLFSLVATVADMSVANQHPNLQQRGETYRSVEELSFDSQSFVERIKQEKDAGKIYSEVFETVELQNKDATAKRVLDYLTKLQNTVEADDVLMLYLLGHGMVQGEEKESWAFVTYDGTLLTGKDLKTKLDSLRCRTVLFIQACHSGSNKFHQTAIRSIEGKLIFMACAHDELAYVIGKGGLYGQALIEALNEPNNKGEIDMQFLQSLVQSKTKKAYQELRNLYLDEQNTAVTEQQRQEFRNQPNQTPQVSVTGAADFPLFSTSATKPKQAAPRVEPIKLIGPLGVPLKKPLKTTKKK